MRGLLEWNNGRKALDVHQHKAETAIFKKETRHKAQYSSKRWQDQQNRHVVAVQMADLNSPQVQRYEDRSEPDYFFYS